MSNQSNDYQIKVGSYLIPLGGITISVALFFEAKASIVAQIFLIIFSIFIHFLLNYFIYASKYISILEDELDTNKIILKEYNEELIESNLDTNLKIRVLNKHEHHLKKLIKKRNL